MKIDLANFSEERHKKGWTYWGYIRGSHCYEPWGENSDIDMLYVANDDVELIPDENYVSADCVKSDKRIYQTESEGVGVIVVKYSDFVSLIEEQSPLALETIFSSQYEGLHKDPNEVFLDLYKLDKWKLRESFGSIASNSFVKAKKKMTIKESYDICCALKSLFRSIRLLMFACQIAEKGRITDFECAVSLWKEIKEDYKKGFVWEDFKKKYRPIWNEWHSKMVKLCPKPKELYKNNK